MGLVLYKARRLCVSHDMKTKRILLGLGILALLIAFVWWMRTEPMTSSVSRHAEGRSADSQSRPTDGATEPPTTIPLPSETSEPLVARIEAGGQTVTRIPREEGRCDRVWVQPGERVRVAVSYPHARAGEPVAAMLEDGGSFDDGAPTCALTLDARGGAAFGVRMSEERGICRVVLRKGGTENLLDFWVGPELPVRK